VGSKAKKGELREEKRFDKRFFMIDYLAVELIGKITMRDRYDRSEGRDYLGK
jgi:hypothetical protein